MVLSKTNVYPGIPQFYYMKLGFKWVKIILACFPDAIAHTCIWNADIFISKLNTYLCISSTDICISLQISLFMVEKDILIYSYAYFHMHCSTGYNMLGSIFPASADHKKTN